MRHVPCALCGADAPVRYSRPTDHISGETFDVVRCRECRLVYVDPQPEPAELPRYYPSVHQQSEPAGYEKMDARPRAKLVGALLGGRTGRVLDVGCGKGLLLAALRDAGWEVCGTELSEVSGRYARSRGIPVHQVPVEDAPLEDGSFDVVTLFHVLEHLTDPKRSLARIRALLRPDGFLVVEVPNIGSWYARAFGDIWFHYDVPRHLYHFDPATLRRMLETSGFAIERQTTRNLQYDAFGAVQSALNAVLRRRNLLNDFNTGEVVARDLLSGGRPVRDMGALAVSQIALGIGFPLLALAGILASPWVDGGTLRCVARLKA